MLLFCSKFIDGILFNIKLYIYKSGTETGSHFRRLVWQKINENMGENGIYIDCTANINEK